MQGTLFKLTEILVLALLLLSCSKSSDRNPPNLQFTPNQNLPYTSYAGWCGPGYDAVQRYYLRSLFLDFYFWYDDIVDVDPESSVFRDFVDYFDYLVTDDGSPSGSGRPKDRFSFFTEQRAFSDLIESGTEIGYGIRFSFPNDDFGGDPTIAFIVDNTPASAAGLQRGDTIISADGFSSSSQSEFLDRLFPYQTGQSVSLEVRAPDNSIRFVTVSAARFTVPSVDKVSTFPLGSGASAGYILFNDHTRASGDQLLNTFSAFEDAGISELIIDMRYNGGGLLSIANLLASMIAPPALKPPGTIFETLTIRNPNNFEFTPTTDFVFEQRTPDLDLPEVALNRIYVLTGPDTCSASETIINGLRGINVEVIQIGRTTCGKPYGFINFDNCGYSFLPVLFEGVNAMGQGGYIDGFKPANASGFGIPLTGCAVDDDFSSELGDPSERLLSTALYHIENSTCPPVLSVQVQSSSSDLDGKTNETLRSNPQLASPAFIRTAQGLKLAE